MPDQPRECRNCQAPLDGDTRRRYCSTKCKREFNERFADVSVTDPKTGELAPRAVPEYVKKARALAERKLNDMVALDDEVREVMREEIRKHITEQVKDKVLGATDLMATMLPLAMARLYQDLESPVWAEYSRAAAIVMRYTMALGNQDADGANLGKITVMHQVPGHEPREVVLPDTEFGAEVADNLTKLALPAYTGAEVYDPENPESFEADWGTCYACHERKHPDALRVHDHAESGTTRYICVTCRYKRDAELSKAVDPLAGNDGALYHPPA